MAKRVADTGWIEADTCDFRTLITVHGRAVRFVSCPKDAGYQLEMIDPCGEKVAYKNVFRSRAGARRAAGDMIRGFKRYP